MNIHAELFLTFAKVGVMTFGGGYAISVVQSLCIDGRCTQ